MESLTKTLLRLNTVINPSQVFPRYVISPETKTLQNIQYWIQNWKDAYKDHLDGYVSANESQKLISREAALERLIKSSYKDVSTYSIQLSDWASVAGSFPTFSLINPFTGHTDTCANYWKSLIIRATKEESIFSIRRRDLEELLEHCEEHIPYGSIFSDKLFKVLRHSLERQKNFLGLGDLDISKSTYTILGASDTVEDANLKGMIDSAPESEPRPEQYPTKFLYMKARLRYQLAQKAGTRNQEGESNV